LEGGSVTKVQVIDQIDKLILVKRKKEKEINEATRKTFGAQFPRPKNLFPKFEN